MAFMRRACNTPRCGYAGFTESNKCPRCGDVFDNEETAEFGTEHERSGQKTCRNCGHGQQGPGTGRDDTIWFDCDIDGLDPVYVSLTELGRKGCERWMPKHPED